MKARPIRPPKFVITRADGSVWGYTNTFLQAVKFLLSNRDLKKEYHIHEVTWTRYVSPRRELKRELVCIYTAEEEDAEERMEGAAAPSHRGVRGKRRATRAIGSQGRQGRGVTDVPGPEGAGPDCKTV